MCIALFTTAHPDYALILTDNRDEYLLRPTSRPTWWKHPTSGRQILSSRDLLKKEKGTWLGITLDGTFAVLTNYRESSPEEVAAAAKAANKSRGRMVTAWLGELGHVGLHGGVESLLQDDGVKGVGGFSMGCGKLKKQGEGVAIVSNRADTVRDVPVLGVKGASQTWGLSNAYYNLGDEWPKVELGKRLLDETIEKAVREDLGQEGLVAGLFKLLDTDTFPALEEGTAFEDLVQKLRYTIFVPPLGDDERRKVMKEANARGRVGWGSPEGENGEAGQPRTNGQVKSEGQVFEEGIYGTQRQTVVLVDNSGGVTFVERALWDANGNAIARGAGDVRFDFQLEGWNS